MPRSVQLPTPRPSVESLIEQLQMPKARQKRLRAIMDEAWAELEAKKRASSGAAIVPEEKLKNASAAD
ncbi:MAG TPA: hypothetical protein VMA34_13985 [Terracidiphilus sp.]|nr:hypothetical protein [Terracidiphilus sp.]